MSFLQTYDPDKEPSATEWLAVDEAERIALVESYHRRRQIRVPQLTLHATIHVVVENQIALGEAVVIDALMRLRAEGLTRHDAVHAIGMVLAENIYEILKSPPGRAAARPCDARPEDRQVLAATGAGGVQPRVCSD